MLWKVTIGLNKSIYYVTARTIQEAIKKAETEEKEIYKEDLDVAYPVYSAEFVSHDNPLGSVPI